MKFALDWQLIMVFEILEKEFVFAQECIDCQSVRKEKNFFFKKEFQVIGIASQWENNLAVKLNWQPHLQTKIKFGLMVAKVITFDF